MRKSLAVLLLALTLSISGCKLVTTTGQPIAPTITAFNQVLASNTALATTNDSVVSAVTTLNVNGTISDSSTAQILKVQKQIAQADIQLTTILNQGSAYSQANVSTIISLISTIQGAANTLQTQGVIPNNSAALQISTEINTIVTLATTIASELVAANIK